MSGEIRVAPAYLESLARSLRALPVTASAAVWTDTGSKLVDEAYDSLNKKWTKHQADLHDQTNSVAQIVDAIRESLVGVDTQLTAALNQ